MAAKGHMALKGDDKGRRGGNKGNYGNTRKAK
jgi:hypothetical protein